MLTQETTETYLPHQRGKVDHQSSSTGNRNQTLHRQVHPVPLPQGRENLQEKGRIPTHFIRGHQRNQLQ